MNLDSFESKEQQIKATEKYLDFIDFSILDRKMVTISPSGVITSQCGIVRDSKVDVGKQLKGMFAVLIEENAGMLVMVDKNNNKHVLFVTNDIVNGRKVGEPD